MALDKPLTVDPGLTEMAKLYRVVSGLNQIRASRMREMTGTERMVTNTGVMKAVNPGLGS